MRELFFEAVADKTTLDEVYRELIKLFRQIQGSRPGRLGYVAGIINSDGPEYFARNFRILEVYTRNLQRRISFPIFSATEIFHPAHLENLRAANATNQDFIKFWRSILSSGYVTDIFFAPRWDESVGALDEHQMAKILRLRVHYLDALDDFPAGNINTDNSRS